MSEDKRRHLRLPVTSTVFIELLAEDVAGGESAKVAICKTLDVSRGGLRVGLEQELVVGAILQIGVELPDSGEPLYLAGEVRWCLPNTPPETGWTAGFALLNAGDSDIDDWTAVLTRMDS